MLSLNETSHSMLFWARERSQFCSQRITRCVKEFLARHTVYPISWEEVCVCLNRLHLLDNTDTNMTLVHHSREQELYDNEVQMLRCSDAVPLVMRSSFGDHVTAKLRSFGLGRWADGVHLDRTDRLCLVCKSLDCVEDEQHFVFDCPAYHIRSQHLDLLQHCCTIADFMALCEPNTCGGFLRECFACRKQILSV